MYYKIYTNVRDGAWECLADHLIDRLPVDVLKIARINHIDVKKNSSLNVLLPSEMAKSYFNGHKWIVIYDDRNDVLTNRYAIAHELGHIFLGHATTHTKYMHVLEFGKKPKSEQHADMFAQRLLCPVSVLRQIGAISPEEIAEVCRVPLSCAKERSKRLKTLLKRDKFLTHELEIRVFENFKPFIHEFNASKEKTEEQNQ